MKKENWFRKHFTGELTGVLFIKWIFAFVALIWILTKLHKLIGLLF